MSTPKYNKFNTGRTKGYFPLKRWRFNTEQHPVIKSKDRCASSTAKTLLSTQEQQMLVGLTNTLQCNEREAVRIALHEASGSAMRAHEKAFRYAASESSDKGHQGRSSAKQWKLPKAEKELAVKAAKELGITDKEFLRLAIIWLQTGIRDGSVETITNCKLIPFDTEAKKWSRENPGSEAQGRTPHEGVAKLKKAARAAYEEAGRRYRARNKDRWETRKSYLMENGFALPPDEDEQERISSLDALIEIQEADNFQRIVDAEIAKHRLNERELFNFRWLTQIPELTSKDLDFMWEQELAEAKEIGETEETMEDMLTEFLTRLKEEIEQMMTPEEKEQEKARLAQRQKELNEAFDRRYGWVKRAKRQNYYDTDRVFKTWLKGRLDDIFNADS
ncbi:hypothetical protein OA002_02990 [bacterium]|nr:hypothetical protein [bacterium]